ncbi:MAG: MFS transporter [Burkholderiales bacterium]
MPTPPLPRFSVLARIPRSIWALGVVSLLMDVSSEIVHSLLPVFMVGTLGASVFMLGLVDGAAEAVGLIVKVISGAWSDRMGRRKPLAIAGYLIGALSKPLFAIAGSPAAVLGARVIDRIGKGIRGAPRDALVADLAPHELRGAAFGLRQALDTVGAFAGPLIAIGLMLLWANDVRAVFWVAIVPGLLAVAVLLFGVAEPDRVSPGAVPINPLKRDALRRLSAPYWWVVGVGAVFMLARFSEAFLVLRAVQGGLALAWTPLVLVGMNLVYLLAAYPLGKLSDTVSHGRLLAAGLVLLIAADLLLARGSDWPWTASGIALWGLHMGMTQGLLARMVADAAPADLRGTAYGLFNLASGVALLIAGGVAGWLWDRHGAPATFAAGAGLAALALAVLALRPSGSIAPP